jgi:methionyl-tRNA formyltransferase
MTRKSETLVFFGSGPVAAKALELLVDDFAVEAVVTKPVPPGHRGDFPVLSLAETLGIRTFTTANKKQLLELFAKHPVKSRVGLAIDYGIIIPKEVIDYFPSGILNSHFSLLPKWRGPDPITFAILNGDKETGVSLMLIVEALDEGPLLGQTIYTVLADETATTLTKYLIYESHFLLRDLLPKYLAGQIKPYPQRDDIIKPTYSRKLTKAEGVIDWSKPAEQLERQIRAYIEWPKSRTNIAGKDVIITAAHVVKSPIDQLLVNKIGQPFIRGTKQLAVLCGQDLFVIDRLKPAGKLEMTAEAFLAGHKLENSE